MRQRLTASSDEGVTLVELLIAMLIMSIAIVVLVAAMGSVITATAQHRGHAVEETAARNYAEAVQEKIDFRTWLTANMSAGDNTLTVANAAGFQQVSNTDDLYIVVDQETMRVTSRSGNTLTVVNRGDHGGSAVAHPATKSDGSKTFVSPLFRCPTASTVNVDGNLTPKTISLPQDASNANQLTASISSVQYFNPGADDFSWTRTQCMARFDEVCVGGEIRPECEVGYYRVTVAVAPAAAWNTRFHGATTQTQVLIRRGTA